MTTFTENLPQFAANNGIANILLKLCNLRYIALSTTTKNGLRIEINKPWEGSGDITEHSNGLSSVNALGAVLYWRVGI